MKTQFFGVRENLGSHREGSKPFYVMLRVLGKDRYLGAFEHAEKAARYYDAAVCRFAQYGRGLKRAKLNFPGDDQIEHWPGIDKPMRDVIDALETRQYLASLPGATLRKPRGTRRDYSESEIRRKLVEVDDLLKCWADPRGVKARAAHAFLMRHYGLLAPEPSEPITSGLKPDGVLPKYQPKEPPATV